MSAHTFINTASRHHWVPHTGTHQLPLGVLRPSQPLLLPWSFHRKQLTSSQTAHLPFYRLELIAATTNIFLMCQELEYCNCLKRTVVICLGTPTGIRHNILQEPRCLNIGTVLSALSFLCFCPFKIEVTIQDTFLKYNFMSLAPFPHHQLTPCQGGRCP